MPTKRAIAQPKPNLAKPSRNFARIDHDATTGYRGKSITLILYPCVTRPLIHARPIATEAATATTPAAAEAAPTHGEAHATAAGATVTFAHAFSHMTTNGNLQLRWHWGPH